jgi:phosphoglycolate phosphatase
MTLLDGLHAKLINPKLAPRPFGLAMVDFDGTISLLREGWDKIMVPMMVEELQHLPKTKETEPELTEKVREWVFKLNGQPTIKQMEALEEEVERRGGKPESATAYKQDYLRRLMIEVNRRKSLIKNSVSAPSKWVVPGAYSLLRTLKVRRIPMMLTSGTDLEPLLEESTLLQITDSFDQGIFGPENDERAFSKALAVDTVLRRLGLDGKSLLNIGDGFVETKLTKERGGIAIGVAYDAERPREYHPWRLEQLLAAGADVIVPDLEEGDRLVQALLGNAPLAGV